MIHSQTSTRSLSDTPASPIRPATSNPTRRDTLTRRQFTSRLLLATSTLAGLASARLHATEAQRFWVYLGTNTSPGGSEGIYRAKFDATTGELTDVELAAKTTNPSFVCPSPDHRFLYAVGEVAGSGKRKGGGVSAYAIDTKTGQLTLLNSQDTLGAGPCHVSVDPSGKIVFVANYGGGSSCAYRVLPDGRLSESIGFFQYRGSSIDKNRQQGPHSHCAMFNSTGTHCFVVDLGIDAVMVHAVRPAEGQVADQPVVIPLPKGSGPRHIAINATDTIAYVNGELDMTINVVKLDLAASRYEVVQTLSTVPEGQPMPGYSTAEVRIHPNGQFVYVSNRGHNSIAAFAIQSDGLLKPIGHITGDIKTPRNFNIDPTGRWMLIANQDGASVHVYQIDTKTGLARATGSRISVPKPICVKFVPIG